MKKGRSPFPVEMARRRSIACRFSEALALYSLRQAIAVAAFSSSRLSRQSRLCRNGELRSCLAASVKATFGNCKIAALCQAPPTHPTTLSIATDMSAAFATIATRQMHCRHPYPRSAPVSRQPKSHDSRQLPDAPERDKPVDQASPNAMKRTDIQARRVHSIVLAMFILRQHPSPPCATQLFALLVSPSSQVAERQFTDLQAQLSLSGQVKCSGALCF
eukprot:CAMPEP_0202100284 /NCGR_PEP_ID=MMETSP0965-20130614/3067_1 /ASSEMBLY_ACC=CAM_ASM_000507 /TAXON_ID=4773 /ORGANISM="Schizochytrium aggregatum, Strain ATCC28209" /LENGTH=217 /DNA_ID=CAMNT_0048668939 /DNA_START=45 /DNA_END=696 /DNA_ORIENTATION=-